jgi:hypothetical protein
MKLQSLITLMVCFTVAGSPALAATAKSLPPKLVGGAKPGMKYGDVRLRLLRAGFKAVPRAKDEFCGYNDQCKLPETEACAGTGQSLCTYRYVKNGRPLQVTGRYGEDGALSQEVIIIEYVR